MPEPLLGFPKGAKPPPNIGLLMGALFSVTSLLEALAIAFGSSAVTKGALVV
jgi:hypothetical protein